MKILLVAATEAEIAPYRSEVLKKKHPIDILITGAGMVATAFSLGHHLATRNYDVLLNVGVAGGFQEDIPLGTVLRIQRDQFSELGAEDKDKFLSLEEIGLGKSEYAEAPPQQLLHSRSVRKLAKAKGITVNTVHGNKESILNVRKRIDADMESMEGAAVFYAASKLNIPVLQVRSLSNYVEERNREAWDLNTAIHNLNTWLTELSEELYSDSGL